MRKSLLAASAAVFVFGAAGSAMADAPIVYAPQATTRVVGMAHQGPHVHSAGTGITNGVAEPFYTFLDPTDGGVIDSGIDGGSNYRVHASAYMPGGAGDQSFSSTVWGSADLTTGQLKGTVDNTYANNFGSPLGFVSDYIYDTVYFNNTTSSAVALAISYSVEGSVSLGPGGVTNQGGSAAIYLTPCPTCAGYGVTFEDGAYLYTNRMSFNEGGVYSYSDTRPLWTFTANGTGGTLSALLYIPVGQTAMGIGADLLLDCRAGTDCNYGHTASLGFGPLAEGLSYTSASGVFLTGLAAPNPGGAVPEPATWALMIVGFGGAGAMIRRRRPVAV